MTLALLITAVGGAWADEATITLKCGTTEKTYENVTLPWSTTAEILKEVVTDINFNININAISGGDGKVVKYGNENFTVNGTFSGNATVTVTYNTGSSATITVTAPAPLIALDDTKTVATMAAMPAYDVTVDYELVRDMTVDVDATIADRIRIKKDGTTYVPVTATELVPVITDELDEQNPVTMVLYDETAKTGDYTVKLQKKVEGDTPSWTDATALSVGTFRYVITGANLYDGEITTNEFQLFEGYEVTIPAGEYITYYRDEPLRLDNNETNAELYTISAVGTETATLSGPYDAMKALTPMLVHNKNTEEAKTILLIPCNEPDLALTVAPEFKGTLEATEIAASSATSNNYAFNGKQFVWVKTALAVGQYKAWLEVPTGTQSAPILTLVFGDATKIENTNVPNLTNGDWYDLNGRKLQGKPTKKGVYIMNGRKVVIK